MVGVATPLHFGREHIALVLGANGLGDFVGMRPVIDEGVGSTGRDERWFAGWVIAGTTGYAEVDTVGQVHGVGVWLPPEIIGN